MKLLPVRCELHGWLLLLPGEAIQPRENHVIECEGHMITMDTRDVALVEITEYLPKTRGLTDAEFNALTLSRPVRPLPSGVPFDSP